MPFAATWMELQIVILSEVRQAEKDIPYVWNLKRNDTNEFTCKTERDSQTHEWTYGCQCVGVRLGGRDS